MMRSVIQAAAPAVVAVFAFAALAVPEHVFAQGTSLSVRPPTVEIGGGIGYAGQAEAGTEDATMTSNEPGEDPDPLTFFRATAKTRSGPVRFVQIGVSVSPAWGIEGGFQYSNPTLSVKVDRDAEGVPPVEITGLTFRQYAAEGNVVYHFNEYRFDNRKTVPFVLAGAGQQQQRDAETGVEETARYYQAGVGFKWFSNVASGRARGAGVRLDIRYVFRDGGFDFEDKARRSSVVISATALVGL
jgi:hypothetical protein